MAPPEEKKKKLSSADHCLISSATIGENQQQSSSLFETALGEQKKMNNRMLRKIWICNDVWMDTLHFFDRAQLGLKMALISDRFDVLVDTHFDGKSELTVWRPIAIRKDENTGKPIISVRIDDKTVEFPLPDRPLPSKIRIKELNITYIVDHSVIEVLHANQQIWDRKGIMFNFFVWSPKGENVQHIWNVFVQEIWPILAPNIRHLTFRSDFHLFEFLHHFSPTTLSDLNTNIIVAIDLFDDGIMGDLDGPYSTVGQVLFEWLHTPIKDGRPKQFLFKIFDEPMEWIDNFKQTFLRATDSSVNYNIFLVIKCSPTIEPFELVNGRTNEKLTLQQEGGNVEFTSLWRMKRCPIFEGTAAIQLENWDNNSNKIFFYLNGDINCIGPLSPPAEEEEAAQNKRNGNRTV